MEDQDNREEKKYWLDDPRHVNWIVVGLYAVCALLVAADLLYSKHVHFPWEGWLGFYGLYGFVGCVFLVVAAKQMRRVLMRPEDYYREDDPDE